MPVPVTGLQGLFLIRVFRTKHKYMTVLCSQFESRGPVDCP